MAPFHVDFVAFALSLCLQTEVMKELARRQVEAEQLKQQILQQEIAYNIKQTEALTR